MHACMKSTTSNAFYSSIPHNIFILQLYTYLKSFASSIILNFHVEVYDAHSFQHSLVVLTFKYLSNSPNNHVDMCRSKVGQRGGKTILAKRLVVLPKLRKKLQYFFPVHINTSVLQYFSFRKT
jgi:hypothetical protein